MKVAYVVPISWGGIPHYTAELANKMSELTDTYVIKPQDKNTQLFSENVKVIEAFKPIFFSKNMAISAFNLTNIKNFSSFFSIHKVIKDIDPDIIHYPEVYAHIALAHYVRKAEIANYPVVCTYHNTFSILDLLFNNVMGSLTYGIVAITNEILKRLIRPEGIIVHTKLNKDILTKKGYDPRKIFIIPHGSFTLFRTLFKSSNYKKFLYKNNKNIKKILFFGYILKNKGVEYLIKASKFLLNNYNNIEIIIAGEGRLPNIRKIIDSKSNKIFKIYNYYIPNEMVFNLFTQADVVVLPYIYHQGHSGVLNIAFAFGKPVIITNVGSLPEMVEYGKAGIIIPPRNPKALAEAIIKILEDHKLRKKMERASYKKSEALSWDRIAKKHLRVYEKVVKKWRGIRN